MTKKKIVAIILFLFLSLFMFTFANPGDIKPELKEPSKTKQETKKEEVKDETKNEQTTQLVVNTNTNNTTAAETKKHLAVPVIEIENDKVVILLGEKYDVMEGVRVISEENLIVTADITDTSTLPEGTYTITYTVTDSEGNTATATKEIVILDPNKDKDNDGSTNGEEINEGTDPLDDESFPTKLVVDPKEVKIIKGESYDVMTGVTVTGDKNNQGLEATPSLTDTTTLALGSHKVTYTVTDNYDKTLTGERTIIVASDVNHNNIPDDEETYTLTVNYVFEDGTEAAETYTDDVLQGRLYWAMSPIVDGYVADTFIVMGIMPKHDKDVTVTYSKDANGDLIPDKYQGKLTVTYVMDDGGVAPQAFERYYLKGSIYVVPSPRVQGYIVDRRIVIGSITEDTKEEIVNYYADKNGDGIPDKDQRRLIVTYVMDDGTEAPEADEIYYLIGEDYSFDVPEIEGYMSYDKNFSGTMGEEDVEKTVTYYKDINGDNIPDKYQGVLTINYVMEDGTTAPEPFVKYYNKGQFYYVSIPEIDGYVASKSLVYGFMLGSSHTETVTYYVDANGDNIADRDQAILTINYVMDDGSVAPQPRVEYYYKNTFYRVTVPKIDGYVADRTTVYGFITSDKTEAVTYYVDANHDGRPDKNQRFTITFYNEDGTRVLGRKTVRYGQNAESIQPPVKLATAQYAYTFDGWYKGVNSNEKDDLTNVVLNRNVYARFTSQVRAYNITWIDGNGKTLKTDSVEYGKTPEYSGETPTKTGDAQYSYTFNHTWSPSISSVVGNASYTAQFDRTENEYTVTFYNEDGSRILGTSTVTYGNTAVAPTATKESDAQYTYTFDGWYKGVDSEEQDDLTNVIANRSVYARYTSTVNEYTVTFYNEDGSKVLGTSTVPYGDTAVAPTATKESDAQYTYTFDAWYKGVDSEEQDDLTNVVANRSVYARYTSTVNEYTVTFYNEDGSRILGTSTVTYGNTAVAPTATKESDEQYTYTFDAWYKGVNSEEQDDLTNVVANRSVYARFERHAINSAPTFKERQNITYVFQKEHTSDGIRFTLTFNFGSIANDANSYSVNLNISGLGFNESKVINSSNGGSVTFTYLQPFTYTYFENLLLKTHYSVEELIVTVNAINDQGSATQSAKLWSGVGVNGGDWTSVGIAEQDPTSHLFDLGDVLDAITGTWQNHTYTISNWY